MMLDPKAASYQLLSGDVAAPVAGFTCIETTPGQQRTLDALKARWPEVFVKLFFSWFARY
jgi:hypothetical protein